MQSERFSLQQIAGAFECALAALKQIDDAVKCDRNPETGWRSDEYCEAYMILFEYLKEINRRAGEK